MANNMIIAGDYKDKVIMANGLKLILVVGIFNRITLDKDVIESYEVVDEESKTSAASAVGRGAVGGVLLGPVGLLAGLSAKKKGTYRVVLNWKDGKRSLAEVNDKIYKSLVRILF